MRSAFATLAFAAVAAAVPAAVSSAVAPSSSPPPGCETSYNGQFEIQIVNEAGSKRSIQERNTPLEITLSNGVLTDNQGRTGYVAANSQFQFDAPPQAGAIYTSGFSVCSNGSLAIGADAIWYKCLSGTFYNLYDNNDAGQCSPVYIIAVGGSTGSGTTVAGGALSSATSSASSIPYSSYNYFSGVTTTTAPVTLPSSAVASEIPDGQVTATTAAAPVTQISDGQPQAPTSTPAVCSEYVDGQPQCSSAAPTPACSEYVDGQPQCGTAGVVPAYGTATGTGAYPSYTGPAIASGPGAMATPVAALLAGAFGIAAML